jgi:hypothetical protein
LAVGDTAREVPFSSWNIRGPRNNASDVTTVSRAWICLQAAASAANVVVSCLKSPAAPERTPSIPAKSQLDQEAGPEWSTQSGRSRKIESINVAGSFTELDEAISKRPESTAAALAPTNESTHVTNNFSTFGLHASRIVRTPPPLRRVAAKGGIVSTSSRAAKASSASGQR